jgi:hypothetical protein
MKKSSISAARECHGTNLTAMNPNYPTWMETVFALDSIVQSGFYIYLTCTTTPYPEVAYREYLETGGPRLGRGLHALFKLCHILFNIVYIDPIDPSGDDAVDGKLGILCSDGGFIQRTWPTEAECVKTPVCKDLPIPDPLKYYKSISKKFIAMGQFVYYRCSDENAILDDDSGRKICRVLKKPTAAAILQITICRSKFHITDV